MLPRRTSPWAPLPVMVNSSPRDLVIADSSANNLLGELVFGVARIFASFNDTFVHITDLRFVDT